MRNVTIVSRNSIVVLLSLVLLRANLLATISELAHNFTENHIERIVTNNPFKYASPKLCILGAPVRNKKKSTIERFELLLQKGFIHRKKS